MSDNDSLPMVAELLKDNSGDITRVVINQGKNSGVKPGDVYVIFGIGKEIMDPATGKSLGKLELVRGRGKAIVVQETMSTLASIETRKGPSTTKQISRHGGSFGYMLPQQETITEHQEPVLKEFDGVAVGDFARKANP